MSLYLGSEKVENVTAQITLPVEPSDDLPLANGTASAGTSKKFSRADHVHPMETVEATLVDIPVTSVNNKTGAITLTASDINSVPTTRTINSKALSSNIILNASDVGAISSSLSGTTGQVLTKTANGQAWQDNIPLNLKIYEITAQRDTEQIASYDVSVRTYSSNASSILSMTDIEDNYNNSYIPVILVHFTYSAGNSTPIWLFPSGYDYGGIHTFSSTYQHGSNDKWSGTYFLEWFEGEWGNLSLKNFSPTARKVTLTTSGWSNNQQTITCTGVSASATSQEIRVMPADASKTSAYVSCGISCVAQASNKLTFACDKVPTTAIDVYVVMQSLNFQS